MEKIAGSQGHAVTLSEISGGNKSVVYSDRVSVLRGNELFIGCSS